MKGSHFSQRPKLLFCLGPKPIPIRKTAETFRPMPQLTTLNSIYGLFKKNESTVIKLRFDVKCVKFGDSEMDTKI